MSKKTSTKTTTKSTKPTPARVAPANDKARANALVKLNAAPTKVVKGGTNPAPTPTVPATPTSANDTARVEAIAKLNAAPAVNARKPSRSKPQATRPSSSPRRTLRSNSEPKRLSALDAAAKVLSSLPAKEARAGLGAHELIERMAAAGLWTSPGGKTPAATLYAAMIREITTKGEASRFGRLEAGADAATGEKCSVRASPWKRSPVRSGWIPREEGSCTCSRI